MAGPASQVVRAFHSAVWVGDVCYEVSQENKKLSIVNNKIVTHTERRQIKGTLTLAGDTFKKDEEIEAESKKWENDHKVYNLLVANCHMYTRHIAQFLVGDSYPALHFSQAKEDGLVVWPHTM